MTDLASSSRVVATDLQRAERSINMAARDTAQFLLTTLDITETHKLSPAITHRTVKATISALAALIESQEQMALRAHVSIEKAAIGLGLSEANWGESLPKPAIGPQESLAVVAV